MVTETGTAGRNNIDQPDQMDDRRADYTRDSIRAVRRAQNDRVPVKGYLAWSLYGNFEWPHGFSRAHDFGMIARDPETGNTRHTSGFTLLGDVFRRTITQDSQAIA
jgi:beta-glucosidase